MALTRTTRLYARTGNLPSFNAIAGKVKKKEPELNIPPGLQTQYIRKWESIPDEYILQNFVVEERRTIRRSVSEQVPLFKLLIEQLINRPIDLNRRNDYDDDGDEDEVSSNVINGQEISIQQLKNALINFLDSEATLALFNKAKVHYYGDEEEYSYIKIDGHHILPTEIMLCKENVTFESDQAVINKIKREIFDKITRWRRAKERY
jgi:hypothetical protein